MRDKKFLYENIKSCCFTGYRPQKFDFPLKKGNLLYSELENDLTQAVLSLCGGGCRVFCTGLAMGFDIIAAETVLQIKQMLPHMPIKLVCAIPFEGQSDSFSEDWRARYNEVLRLADKRIVLSGEYRRGCYQRRNEFMVDNSDAVLTWFDGRAGGTAATLCYAQKKNKPIINLHASDIRDYSRISYYEVLEEDKQTKSFKNFS